MPLSVIAVMPGSSDAAMVCDSLGRDGINVRLVPSLQEALRLLAARPDNVVLYDADTGQPWRDALPRLVEVRPGVHVVLLTQLTNRQTWLDLFEHGGFDLLRRPFRPTDLCATVRCALDPPVFFHAAAA
jgi:NtrC-family two-component system response regulator AlgB